jgi:hypothetical protein
VESLGEAIVRLMAKLRLRLWPEERGEDASTTAPLASCARREDDGRDGSEGETRGEAPRHYCRSAPPSDLGN